MFSFLSCFFCFWMWCLSRIRCNLGWCRFLNRCNAVFRLISVLCVIMCLNLFWGVFEGCFALKNNFFKEKMQKKQDLCLVIVIFVIFVHR